MDMPEIFPTPEIWYEHRVSYGETDAMGLAYYGEYFHFFERARGHYIRELGMSYAEVERKGVLLPVREAGCRYRSSARYDDKIWIRTGISRWRKASLIFVYELWDADKKTLLAKGFTEHACVGKEGKPTRFPQWFIDFFNHGQ